MNYLELSPSQLERHRERIIQFLKKHGDNRITHRAIRWLRSFDVDHILLQEGTSAIAAIDQSVLQGFLMVSDYGRDESFIVVHQEQRTKNIGSALIQQYLAKNDKLYGRVALDNIPSLKLCLSNGMVGFKLTEGPTGKPTLWLGLGNWKKDDIQ